MKKINLILLSSIIVILASCSASPPKDTIGENPMGRKLHGHADVSKGEIAPAALFEKLQKKEPLVLLDVREEYEYEEVRIPGTTNRIGVKELSIKALEDSGIKKDAEIVIYCRSGSRSKSAAKLLRDLGFTNVWELNSGIIHWIEDGFPAESGKENSPVGTSSQGVQSGPAPAIAFDRTSHDFGEVRQFGGIVETTFKITNEGSSRSPLIIGKITTSCSCTEAVMESNTILPGEEKVLTVRFNPNLHEEPKEKFSRTIFIPTNDPNKPEAELTISVDILEGK